MSLQIEDLKKLVEANNMYIKLGIVTDQHAKITYTTPRKNLKFLIQILKVTTETGTHETSLKCEATITTQTRKRIKFEITYEGIKSLDYADSCINEFATEYDSIDKSVNKSK